MNQPKWIRWAQEIFSLRQAGLTYCRNEFDLERYRRLQEITAEMIASQSEIEQEAVLKSFSMQAGYITPKIDVRGAVIRDAKILMIQERADGRWTMPGGWADLGNALGIRGRAGGLGGERLPGPGRKGRGRPGRQTDRAAGVLSRL